MGISEATVHRLRLNHALHAFTSLRRYWTDGKFAIGQIWHGMAQI